MLRLQASRRDQPEIPYSCTVGGGAPDRSRRASMHWSHKCWVTVTGVGLTLGLALFGSVGVAGPWPAAAGGAGAPAGSVAGQIVDTPTATATATATGTATTTATATQTATGTATAGTATATTGTATATV